MVPSRAAAPAAVAVVAAAATLVVTLSPAVRFAYRQHELHIGFDTAAALIGLLAAYLLLGRFRRSGRVDDLALYLSLSLFALANLVFGAVPGMLAPATTGPLQVWAPLLVRLLGAGALAAAAFLPHRRVHLSPRGTVAALTSPLWVVAAAGLIMVALAPLLPSGIDASIAPEASTRPVLVGHPVVLGAQLVAAALFATAAVGFARRGGAPDRFVDALAVAAVLGAFARLNYALYPSLYTEWVYTGDAFRFLFYAVILWAALREISSYWRAVADAAVLDERRRIARDLHDGVAQEVAVISRSLRRLDPDHPVVQRASAAAARALADARGAIVALAEPEDEPLDTVLARVAPEVAAREGISVGLALAPAVRLPADHREALARVVSEAITNAARHGGADVVRIELAGGRRVRLRIVDTGAGFDPSGIDGRHSFGIRGMRERVAALNGAFRLSSVPGHGTEIEVEL